MGAIEQISDRRLVHRAVDGDEDAFAELARRYYAPVYSIAYAKLMNHAAAEDMTQDTLLRAYEKLRQLRQPDRFASWIARIAVTGCVDFSRKASREIAVGHHDELRHAADPRALQDESDRDADLQHLLEDALRLLPEQVRTPTIMRYMGDASYAQIAEALHISARAAEGRVERGLARLRAYFARTDKITDAIDALRSCAFPAAAGAEAAMSLREALTGRAVDAEPVRPAHAAGIAAWAVGAIFTIAAALQLYTGRQYPPHAAYAGDARPSLLSWLAVGVGSGEGRVGTDATAQLTSRLAEAMRDGATEAVDVPVSLMPPAGRLGDTRIVFASDEGGDSEIYVTDRNGGNALNISNHPAKDVSPAWSPDGQRVAFASERGRVLGARDIYIVRADGSDLRNVTRGTRNNHEPQWSPDGTRIAFTSDGDGTRSIYTMAPDGTQVVRLTHDGARDIFPHWSPDGRTILFESDIRDPVMQERQDLYVINADGSGRRNLTRSDWNDHHGVWSPDGRLIAFHSYRERNNEIYVMRADGAAQRRLTFTDASNRDATFSPDGSRILFASNRDGAHAVYSMDLAGNDVQRISGSTGSASSPAWSPFPPSAPSPAVLRARP